MYTYSIYLSTSDLLSFIISNTGKHEFCSIWKWRSCCNDVMNHANCVIKRDVCPHSCTKNIRGISFCCCCCCCCCCCKNIRGISKNIYHE